ncbi:Crotonobetainyl-CoA:carnitine CoA-transferase CaiB [Agrococcus baldri]|uniref:Crotonobetainyl-CoA:carnitine CoA-transferase CaiB n=1 Tax=Agrococcus baldri TaxID=153730 RepID=A0AA94HLS9_9MICO|nr:CoA transferase [Agrococcus baldri]SFS08281.1 Crotonobetainyl-CoA:carnitine CoA-transferase CaiB [Agrococcus baldri]
MTAEHAARAAPLAGVRVVTIAVNLPGPVAAARLVSLGAAVTSVLPPAGDPLQGAAPSYFDALHVRQRLLTLDLRQDAGRRELEALLADADVLLTSHRARTLAKLGLAFADVSARHAHLCQVDIVGHGAGDADVPGHDLTYQAATGLLDPQRMPVAPYADLAAAEQASTAVLATLLARSRDGAGARIEVAIAAAAEQLAMPLQHGLTGAHGPLGGAHPLYAVYPASEGHVALAALEPHFSARLVQLLELEDVAADPPRLGRALAESFCTRTAEAWEAWARAHDLPLAAVRTSRAAAER